MKMYYIAITLLLSNLMLAGNKEIEYKIQVYTKQDRINFAKKLIETNLAKFKNETMQKDTYFISPHSAWNGSSGYFFTPETFRLRESPKGNSLCYKKCLGEDSDKHSCREEYETKVEDPTVMKKFLSALVGEKLEEKIIAKTRTVYLIGDLEIAFDIVTMPDLGEFIEIEVKKEVTKEEGLKEIEAFLKEHGLTKFKLLTQSYFIMAMNPGYDFSIEKNLQ